ncbi:MAG: MotA/TolQ/ExbB proton channel family protein [Opitutales bacterium]
MDAFPSLDLGLFQSGGPLMWPLLLLSVIGFVFFLERTLYLHQGSNAAERFLEGIKNSIRKRRLLEALTVCEEAPGPLPQIVKAALLNYRESPEKMRLAVQDAALTEIPLLERRIGTIAAIAKISPLIGLLGTVLSLLTGFYAMQEAGPYADASVFSGLLAQALVTTAAGLGISAMAYLAHHFLNARVRAIVQEMEWAAAQVMQFLQSDLPDDLENGTPRPAPRAEPAPVEDRETATGAAPAPSTRA